MHYKRCTVLSIDSLIGIFSCIALMLVTYSEVHGEKGTSKKQWMIDSYHYCPLSFIIFLCYKPFCHSSVYTSRFFTVQRCTKNCFILPLVLAHSSLGLMARPNICFALETCITKPMQYLCPNPDQIKHDQNDDPIISWKLTRRIQYFLANATNTFIFVLDHGANCSALSHHHTEHLLKPKEVKYNSLG